MSKKNININQLPHCGTIELNVSITYAGTRKIIVKVGEMLGLKLRPRDLRKHAITYASRAGVQIEIISKVIVRHSDLSTTQ